MTNNIQFQKLKSPIFIALDVDSLDMALTIADDVGDLVGGFKIGPRLALQYGKTLFDKFKNFGPIFLDHKFFDIPNTMESSVRTAFDCGATFVTIHAQAGREALERLAELEKELNEIRPFKILAVTILTSFDQNSLPGNSQSMKITEQVKLLTQLSMSCGITGVVCSPFEIELVKSISPQAFVVTPGIRFTTDDLQDQKRVMSPRDAIELGASALVVGRPVVESKEPREVVLKILEEIN